MAIAGIVAMRPSILILDEATSMLDPEGRQELIQSIKAIRKEYGMTVLSITHDLDEVALSDRVLVLKKGKVESVSSPRELFSRGSELVDLGLDIPFSALLTQKLRNKGLIDCEDYLTEKELVEQLWGISLENVSYIYQAGTPFEGRALFDMTTTIKDGSYTAFIGHTGSGKSTIMQLLNGLYLPTSGQVHVDDTIITSQSKNKDIKPIRKKVGLVFQFPESQLFAETVLEDVAFGPQNFGVSKEEAEQRAIESLKLVGLPEEFHGQNPFDLSGGQMRRVAIAGILAMQPDIFSTG